MNNPIWVMTSAFKQLTLEEVHASADAVLLACGQTDPEEFRAAGLDVGKKGLVVHGTTAQTSDPAVFAAGNVVRANDKILKSMAAAKAGACTMR